ncbi:MAG: hypothetical protein IAG13_20880 [Deltaproteobacteria bacterium]|nr:hypothetical protein [Nannocystaceae bacterium]
MISRPSFLRVRASTFAVLLLYAACNEDVVAPASPPVAGAPVQERFGGTVEEVLPAGSYTYFRLRVAEGDERWVVISGAADRDAERLAVATFSHHEDFVSRRLDRSFHNLYFAAIDPQD